MKATYIAYKDTDSFPKNLLSYLERDERLAPYIRSWPDIDEFEAQIALKKGQIDRKVLVSSLTAQYAQVSHRHNAVLENITALGSEHTFTVTTGHQLNLFTGPLYFIFKIVSAIRLAKDLKDRFPDYHFVPVYWMATEDHDFAEINHTKLYGKRIGWDVETAGATGRIKTEGIREVVTTYQNMLGLSGHSDKLSDMVSEAYLGSENLAEATRSLVNQLFGAYGLVILDADRAELKQRFSSIMEADLREQNSWRTIEATSQSLKKDGFATQVQGREINFFYLTDDFRERIIRTEAGYEVLNQDIRFTEAELIKGIQNFPERFSPNVVMRPLYQEVILPNLAYIGGGAEISYWLQLKATFDHYEVPFPLLIPRNSALITDDQMVSKIFRFDLTLGSIFRDADVLKKEYVRRHTKHRLTLNDERMELNAIFGKLKLRAHKIDPSLGPSTEAVNARLKKALNRLEKKLLKAEQKNHQEALIQIERIKDHLFPGGVLQERTANFGLLYVKYGDALIDELIRHFHPLDFKFTVLY